MNLLLASAIVIGGASGLVGLLVHLLILCLILGLIWWVLTMIPLPAPFGQVVRVVFCVVCVIILIYFLLGIAGCTADKRLTPAEIAAYQGAVHQGVSDYKTLEGNKK